jgi:hypothetical protein
VRRPDFRRQRGVHQGRRTADLRPMPLGERKAKLPRLIDRRLTGIARLGPCLGAWWTAEGQEIDRARRALRLQRLEVSEREDPFASVIRCAADPAKDDKRTRSKWSRVMRYAAAYKPDSEPLGEFIRRKGGINACAARFSRYRGRVASSRTAE